MSENSVVKDVKVEEFDVDAELASIRSTLINSLPTIDEARFWFHHNRESTTVLGLRLLKTRFGHLIDKQERLIVHLEKNNGVHSVGSK